MLQKLTPSLKAPVILFQYYNPMLRCGVDKYCERAQQAGAAGMPHFQHMSTSLEAALEKIMGHGMVWQPLAWQP